MIMKLRVI